ncbi:hypothetical protein BMF94_6187 [Rhodotorula taiwanensis]|uniref:Uncharacterized protein n=1 Tax=Rhodotorula taiwanensis TaxID=741276 RepID=A0A2S5B1Y6_9BASI|nr:hypothetical protein BMF94_6187 [Rhodotorula taiwanensis]
MVLFGFGDFDYACRNIPSMPICNLFFRQLLVNPAGTSAPAYNILGLPAPGSSNFNSAVKNHGVGGFGSCYIPRAGFAGGESGRLGNIANLILCGIAVLVGLGLAAAAIRRTAAVGRVEYTTLFVMYALVQGAQLADNSGLLRQGSLAISWVTAIHTGLLVGLFWNLVWAAFLSLQVVEDGTLFSLIPMFVIGIILTVGSGYIAADTALTITNYFRSEPARSLHNNWLFVLTIIWPAAAAAVYFIIQAGVVVRILREKKPLFTLLGAAVAFIAAQAFYYALGHKICTGTNGKIDSSWIATLLETVSIGLIFAAWQFVTEDEWESYDIPTDPSAAGGYTY